jgi:UDP-N-acetylglucosamine diphosphorylase/glucosamine-1-phosphate N-acetyltransferase
MIPNLSKVSCIILAAGKGVRMKSDLPKVLHILNGKPLIGYVLDTVSSLNLRKVAVVIGCQGEMVIDFLKDKDVEFVWQKEQLGTGHAVIQSEPIFRDLDGDLLVLCGDVPLLRTETVIDLLKTHQQKKAKATVLTSVLDDPKGYGRIIRDKNGDFERIVEDKDAILEERKIKEINTGEMCFSAPVLFSALKQVKRDNLQKEYYITDVLGILKENGEKVEAMRVQNPWETKGINSTSELLQMEEYLTNIKLKSGVEHKA